MPPLYSRPAITLEQEFQLLPTELTDPLRTLYIGPLGRPIRYAVADERELGLLGAYVTGVAHTQNYPDKTTGSRIDSGYTKVHMIGAKLRYFRDLIGAGGTIAHVASSRNRVRSSTLAFKTNTASARSADFLDRDVQIGDKVWLRGSVAELVTYVTGFAYEAVAASVGSASADASNQATVTQVATVTKVGGPDNEIVLAAVMTNYNALLDGTLQDTYTITVTGASVGGDLTTGRLSVTTASGYEFITNLEPAAVTATKTFGLRGLGITFTLDGGATTDPGEDEDDLIVGQSWTIVARQAYTAPTIASGGTYTGTVTATYIAEVIAGGQFADADLNKRPRLAISTTQGNDGVASVSGLAASSAAAIGTKGVTLTFSGGSVTGLRKGDKFYITATAASEGRASTLILGHDLPSSMQSDSDLDLELYIGADIEIPEYQALPSPVINWTQSDTQVTLAASLQAYHSSWTDDGVQQPLPVVSGTWYLTYREWLASGVGDITAIPDLDSLNQVPGPLDEDNPLKWAAYIGIANSLSTAVRISTVANPDSLDSWSECLAVGKAREDFYGICPVSTDLTVLNLVAAHVRNQSGPTVTKYRKGFFGIDPVPEIPIVTAALTSDQGTAMATVIDDPTVSGNQYTRVTLSGSNLGFTEMGVQAGDIFRTGYTTDLLGGVTYTSYVIDAVLNETALRLVAGPASPISVAQKFEIWHTNTLNELAEETGKVAAAFAARQIVCVYPDFANTVGGTYRPEYAAAAMAGAASGLVPHHDLTRYAITGVGALNRPRYNLSEDQLDLMAAYGVSILTRTVEGTLVCRDALTTDRTSVQTETESYGRNVDSISKLVIARVKRYLGQANLVQSVIDQVYRDLMDLKELLLSRSSPLRGSQIINLTVLELRQHAVTPTKLVIRIQLELPFPIKYIDIELLA